MTHVTGPIAEGSPRSVLGRALGVLGAFSDSSPELALADIVAATALPPATAHRIVAELVAWGALERVGRGRYRIGMRLWRVGALAPSARNLREAALPPDAGPRGGDRATWCTWSCSTGTGRCSSSASPGRTTSRCARGWVATCRCTPAAPARCCSPTPRPRCSTRSSARGLPRLAPGTITDAATLRHALDDVRRTGYCLSREEMTEGAASVAAPISGAEGHVVAALAVVVPVSAPLPPFIPAVQMAPRRRLAADRVIAWGPRALPPGERNG